LFFYVLIFFSSSRIKNTKTIPRVHIHDIDGVYRRLSTAKKCRQEIKHEFFCGTGFYKRQEKNYKEKKKEELLPAIGKNYINKSVSFLLTFYL
jgi:hypothetical protein